MGESEQRRWTLYGCETDAGTPWTEIRHGGPQLREHESVEVMPVAEHEEAMAPLARSIANQREENRHLIRQLAELRAGDPENISALRRQLERANSALARSINRGQAAEAERDALREAARWLLALLDVSYETIKRHPGLVDAAERLRSVLIPGVSAPPSQASSSQSHTTDTGEGR